MSYRRNRPNWRRGGRDLFPLAMVGLVAGMILALVATAVWATFGGGRAAPAVASASEGAEAAGGPAGQPDRAPTGGPDGQAVATVPAAGEAEAPTVPAIRTEDDGPAGGAARPETSPDGARRRSVVTAVASRRPPALRPRAPADTTAAGHAGLAESLLAAGDTSGAIAAYSAFLVRNTHPAREREAIARLREIGGFRR